MKYLVTFTDKRIGRNRNVDPLTVDVGDAVPFGSPGGRADVLAEAVYRLARKNLVSQDVEVHVDLDGGKGNIFAGFQSGGTFAIERVEEVA